MSGVDFESLPLLGSGFSRKSLLELKAYNSYTVVKEEFSSKVHNKLYESESIDEEFDSAMLELKILYRSLAGSDRLPYKSKEYSF